MLRTARIKIDVFFTNVRRFITCRNPATSQLWLESHQNSFTLVLNGRYHLAPLKNPQNILDLGTGTGIWALDVAEYGHPGNDCESSL